MKKILFLTVIVIAFSCKNNTEKSDIKVETDLKKQEVLEEIASLNFSTLGKLNVNDEMTEEYYIAEPAVLLSRAETYKNSAVVHSRKLPIMYLNTYRFSLIAKQGNSTPFIGLRILGQYPDRVDAVFNLSDGSLVGVEEARDFENGDAAIEDLGNGWFRCSVTADAAADEVSLLFGPTTNEKSVNVWEAKSESQSDIYIIPTSLKLHEVKYQ